MARGLLSSLAILCFVSLATPAQAFQDARAMAAEGHDDADEGFDLGLLGLVDSRAS